MKLKSTDKLICINRMVCIRYSKSISSLLYELSDIIALGLESSLLYQLSTFSGPLLAIALTSLVCFIPYHNPMEESEYWYEFHILVQVWMPFHIGTTMLYGKYFANFKYDKILTSYLFIYGFGLASYIIIVAVYYYVRTYINGLNPPMPWTYYFGGFMPLCVAFFANWFRYLIDI